MLTLIGNAELLPPPILLPVILLEYCTGSLLSPSFTLTIRISTMRRITSIPTTFSIPVVPALAYETRALIP